MVLAKPSSILFPLLPYLFFPFLLSTCGVDLFLVRELGTVLLWGAVRAMDALQHMDMDALQHMDMDELQHMDVDMDASQHMDMDAA